MLGSAATLLDTLAALPVMSSTRSRLALTWVTVVDAWLRIGWLCSRTCRMVSVVSSRVRPSFNSGTANRRTSSTKARAAISPAHSPADTRALLWSDFSSRVLPDRNSGWWGNTSRGHRRSPSRSGGPGSAAAPDDRPQLRHPGGQRGLHATGGRAVVVAADERVGRLLLGHDPVGVVVRI